ncbi:FtsX-like permease family protein [Microbacterium sp. DT81.1]|uniref:FtsX-like permease family protein n=1 Tax=Microbacterium sp. DT81.1 TaxID=3393413 RepID=UPI003CFA2841
MTATRLALVRVGAYRSLLAGIAITVAMSVALLCGLSAWVAVDTRHALRAAFADEATSYAQVQTRIADDRTSQNAAADALFADLFGDAARIQRTDVGEGDSTRVAWRITPRADLLDPGRLARLSSGVDALPDAFRASDAAVQGSEDSGDLAEALDAAAIGVAAASAIAPVPVALVAVLAWFAVLELSRLLGAARGRESVLLRARGLSRRQLSVLTTAESAGLALLATALGLGTAAAVLAVRDGGPGIAAALAGWPLAVAAAVTFALTLGLQGARAARQAGTARAGAGRIGRAATSGAAVLLVLAAGVFVWQALSSRGAAPDDSWHAIALAIAPALGVAAVAVLAVLMFAPAARVVAVAAARRVGFSPAEPARQVARRVMAFSTAIAMIAIAVAGATLAAGYLGTWRAASDNAARLGAGAQLRTVASIEVTPERIAPGLEIDGVSVVTPALTADLVIGDGGASLVALRSDSISRVLLPVEGMVDPDAVAAALAWEETSAALPDAATGLRVTARVTTAVPEAAQALRIGAWVTDATGTPARVSFESAVLDDGQSGWALTAEAALPTGTAPWRLLSVDATRDASSQGVNLLVSDAELASLEGAAAQGLEVEPLPEPSVLLHGFGAEAVSGAAIWSGAGLAPPPTPAVISQELADGLGLEQGDPVDTRFDGTGRTAALVVAGIAPAIAGASSSTAVMVALDALSQNLLDASPQPGFATTPLPPNGVWAAGRPRAAADLGDAIGAPVQNPSDAAAAITSGLVPAWWASAVGGAALAGVALVALLAALAAQRAGEVLVLRALGSPPREQSRSRVVEALFVAVLAAALGLVGGLILASILVPVMAETAVPGAVVATGGRLVLQPGALLAALAVLAVALGAAAALTAYAVRRQASSTRLEEAAP